MFPPLLWEDQPDGSSVGRAGGVELFAITPARKSPPSGDGTDVRRPVKAWLLTCALPTAAGKASQVGVISVPSGKARAQDLLANVRLMLLPGIADVSRFTVDGNTVPITDDSYDTSRRAYVERGPYGWAIRSESPAGPILNYDKSAWVELDEQGDIAEYDFDDPATVQRPFDEAYAAARSVVGLDR
ncbi:hypothetical protein ETD86_37325 [Nonomuraea turkmeniaca]|uniref:Uncharacterized protein n=1 Tax=Nonomuraea turkmeniaca TaxID=103838 RepID=A0A5S4F4K4_9ACTN|nr:hypothetical protein [Nonomuraea turkmeniaca]TMR10980.1 hypothetical protein ETD86_37325 [Nonomuraea turkmeniaca]